MIVGVLSFLVEIVLVVSGHARSSTLLAPLSTGSWGKIIQVYSALLHRIAKHTEYAYYKSKKTPQRLIPQMIRFREHPGRNVKEACVSFYKPRMVWRFLNRERMTVDLRASFETARSIQSRSHNPIYLPIEEKRGDH